MCLDYLCGIISRYWNPIYKYKKINKIETLSPDSSDNDLYELSD